MRGWAKAFTTSCGLENRAFILTGKNLTQWRDNVLPSDTVVGSADLRSFNCFITNTVTVRGPELTSQRRGHRELIVKPPET